MFWVILVGLFVLTFPVNAILLKSVWHQWYPIHIYQELGESVDTATVMRAQIRAILLFGVLQPVLSATPLLFGGKWWHYVVCLFASTAYAASGSPQFFLDKVRSSPLMRIGTFVPFGIASVVFTLINNKIDIYGLIVTNLNINIHLGPKWFVVSYFSYFICL